MCCRNNDDSISVAKCFCVCVCVRVLTLFGMYLNVFFSMNWIPKVRSESSKREREGNEEGERREDWRERERKMGGMREREGEREGV